MRRCSTLLAVSTLALSGLAQEEQAELARKLANPVANLISVPLQYNRDENYGAGDEGVVDRLNIQPVIPLTIGDDWNLITRTIVPLIDQRDVPLPGREESGLGDILASQFFSPKAPTAGGWIWGAGPVELLPTASEDALGADQLALGPTFVALKQQGPWTIGLLANHLWSVEDEPKRPEVNASFVQPFVSYVTRTMTTLSLNTEATYDWEGDAWSVPVNAILAQMVRVGPQVLQVGLGARYWAESPDGGPEDWGVRAVVTFLFPK